MLAPTHSVFGIFLTLIILAFFGVEWGLHWTIILFAALGAIVPDIDHQKSVVGKIFSPAAKALESRYGHRTVTHSFLGWAVASVIFAVLVISAVLIFGLVSNFGIRILDLVLRWIAAFSIGYFSHLVLDMFNKRGSMMFWPDPGRDVIPRNPKFRLESGAPIEVLIFFILFALMVLAFPISKYGLASSLRWLLATPGSAIEEFKTMKNRTYLEFKGVMGETRQEAGGKAEILDVSSRRLVILFNGGVYTLSDELSADITASHVRTEKTRVPIKTERREFKDESREHLLSQIPKGALVSGTVRLPEDMQIVFPPFPGSYKTMEQKGSDLILSFASKDQIEKLALNEYFDLQNRKDRADLISLYARSDKIRAQIKEIESGKGLTPLGKQLMQSKEEAEKERVQLAELGSQLNENSVKIDELKAKMRARKFVFSGEVYLRQ
ncbi:MAG: metal-dependent hydrolase [Candidatus Saganbacteria bacterium]|nr:metal-dependent hydrolase [Candidatus Saganbacteria bacterium]